MEAMDWYFLVRRASWATFILLTIWGVAQASSMLALEVGVPAYFSWAQTLNQWANICLWPIFGAPMWYRIVYLTLAFWLIYPHIVITAFGR